MTAAVYLDSSAVVKLAVPETESAALRAFLAEVPWRVTSVIAQIESLRAVRRRALGPSEGRMQAVWQGLSWVALSAGVRRAAARLGPPELRSLDAIHLASALELGPDLGGMVTYDARLAAAARTVRIRVWSPR